MAAAANEMLEHLNLPHPTTTLTPTAPFSLNGATHRWEVKRGCRAHCPEPVSIHSINSPRAHPPDLFS